MTESDPLFFGLREERGDSAQRFLPDLIKKRRKGDSAQRVFPLREEEKRLCAEGLSSKRRRETLRRVVSVPACRYASLLPWCACRYASLLPWGTPTLLCADRVVYIRHCSAQTGWCMSGTLLCADRWCMSGTLLCADTVLLVEDTPLRRHGAVGRGMPALRVDGAMVEGCLLCVSTVLLCREGYPATYRPCSAVCRPASPACRTVLLSGCTSAHHHPVRHWVRG